MATRATCTNYTTIGNQKVTINIESPSYVGTALELVGTGAGFFTLDYEQLDIANIYSTNVQKARAEFSFYNTDASTQTLTDEFINSSVGDFILEYYLNDALVWKGDVMFDLSVIEEGKSQFSAPFVRVTAKDFTTLEQGLFLIEDQREEISTVIGRIVSQTNYDIEIISHTDWVTSGTNASNDFLRQVFIDTRNLRNFTDDGDEQITLIEALQRILKANNLLMRLADGKFVIDQIRAYSTPSSVLRSVYDKDGVFISQSNVNTVIDANSQIKIITGSQSEISPAYKRVSSVFNHRTNRSDISYPSFVRPETGSPDVRQMYMASDESFALSGRVFVSYATPVIDETRPIASIRIRHNALYWNDGMNRWQSLVFDNLITLENSIDRAAIPGTTAESGFSARINITPSLTETAGTLEITLNKAIASGLTTSITTYNDMQFTVESEQDITALGYVLEQAGSFSENYNNGEYFFGDGPTEWSPAAMRRSITVDDLTVLWGYRGDTPTFDHHVFRIREILNFHRQYNKLLKAVMRDGVYSPTKSLSYDSSNYYFIGGRFDGFTGDFEATFVLNQFDTSITDALVTRLITGTQTLSSPFYTAIQLSQNNAIEQSGSIAYRLAVAVSDTVSQIIVTRNIEQPYIFRKDDSIRLVNPITLDAVTLKVSDNQIEGSSLIPIEPFTFTTDFPIGSWVFVSQDTIQAGIAIGRDSVRIFAESSNIGITTSASDDSVTTLPARLNARVNEGDDLILVRLNDGVRRSFTVAQTAGPGLVTLQLDQPTVFDAPAGSYILGDLAQYDTFLQVTPGGALISAQAVRQQNAFALTSSALPIDTYTSIPVTSVRSLTLRNGTAIGVQDRSGNTQFFTVDGDQVLSGITTSITVTSEATTTAINEEASVFQPMWNQSAQLSVQAGQIALRVTQAEVQNLIDENIGGLIPSVNFTFINTDEGFTTNNVTLTAEPTYVEYLVTGSSPHIQKVLVDSYDADDNPVVTIRVQRVSGTNWNGAFGWSTDGTNFFTQAFPEPSNVDNDFSFATIDLTSNVDYTGTIEAIRLILGSANNDEFYVDQITVGKFNPQTEILENLSTRLTAAEAGIVVEADKIDLFTLKSNELNRIARVTSSYGLSLHDEITIDNIRSDFELRNGQALFLVNVDGTFQSVTVNTNQSPLVSPLKISPITFTTAIEIGAMVYESSFTQSTRISQGAGQIVLKAEETAGAITKLALVRLDATAASGSEVFIQANKIIVDGQTTFLNSLRTNGIAGKADVSTTIRSTTAPTVRPDGSAIQAGDTWIKTNEGNLPHTYDGTTPFNVNGWVRDYTQIDGGVLTTGTIRADLVQIQNAASSPDIVLDGTGITFKQIGASNDTEIKRSIHWINPSDTTLQSRIVSYGDGSNIAVDVAGTQNAKNMRLSVRRNISGNQDLSIGIAGNTNAFVTGSAVGDAVISVSNGKLWINDDLNVTGATVVPNATSATHALNRQTGDGRYARLDSNNTFTANNIFDSGKLLIKDNDVGEHGVTISSNLQGAFRTLIVPTISANRTFAFIDQAQTFTANQTITGNLILGTQTNKATITYATNTARTLTIPSLGGNRTFAFIDQAQTFSGNNIHSGTQRFTNAQFSLESLPTSDPGIPGRLWNDSTTLRVSP